jgi:pimeloyl-ACP methyl ester carboxylesterase
MKRVLFLLFGAAVVFLAGSTWIAMYPVVPVDLGGAPNLDKEAREVRIPVGAKDHLDGWLLPGTRRALIVIFHGYGRNHTRAWRYAQFLRKGGYAILAFDFRSSRAVSRKPTTLGGYEMQDAAAMMMWLREQPDLRSDTLAFFGESLGGTVALVTASLSPEVRAVCVDGGFASGRWALHDASWRWAHAPGFIGAPLARGLGWLLSGFDPYALDALSAARRLSNRPTFFIHGENDDRISTAEAEALWRAAGSREGGLWILRGKVGHNEGWLKDRAEYERRVSGFFAEHLP